MRRPEYDVDRLLMARRDEAAAHFQSYGIDRLSYPWDTRRGDAREPVYAASPWMIGPRLARTISSGVRAVLEAIDLLLTDDGLPLPVGRQGLLPEVPGVDASCLVASGQDWARSARPDLVVDGGKAWIVDLNASPWLGGLVEASDLCAAASSQEDVGRVLHDLDARPSMPLRDLVDHLRRTDCPEGAGLLVVSWWAAASDDYPGRYARGLASALTSLGLACAAAPLEALCFDEDGVRLGYQRVGAVYRFFEEDRGEDPARGRVWTSLCRRIADGRVRLVGNFVGDLYAHKGMLALVSEAADEGLLPGPLARTVRTVLPWTRLLAPRRCLTPSGRLDLVAYALAWPDRLVLKPADGYDGDGVFFGARLRRSEWEDALHAALHDSHRPWVLQTDVRPPSEEVVISRAGTLAPTPVRSVLGAFFVGREFVGGIRRWSADGRANISPSLGAGDGPVFLTAGR
ncbi:hypothetical protein [Actinomadura sp. B10D3]|uniref:hypothetical protein n=1 Tax=Actinomadura sp. B10D3 TaxID=3153557 RepID=UPI00325F7260